VRPEPGLVRPEPGLVRPEPGLVRPEPGLVRPEPGLDCPLDPAAWSQRCLQLGFGWSRWYAEPILSANQATRPAR